MAFIHVILRLGHLTKMKWLSILLLGLAGGISSALAAPMFPAELTLSNGTTLHKASAVRWMPDYVVVKHVGGLDPVRYVHISEPLRAQILAMRDAMAVQKIQASQTEGTPAPQKLQGQCFITTRGAQSYKMSEVLLRLYPAEIASRFDTNLNTIDLPRPVATCTTDADGTFALTLPEVGGPWIVIAQGRRLIVANHPYEEYEWVIPAVAGDSGKLLLTATNAKRVIHGLNVSD